MMTGRQLTGDNSLKPMTRYRWYVGLNVEDVPIATTVAEQLIRDAAAYTAAAYGGVTHYGASGVWQGMPENTVIFEVLVPRGDRSGPLPESTAVTLRNMFMQAAVLYTEETVFGELV